MSKGKGRKRSFGEKFLWGMSVLIVGSMVLSLILVALPGPPSPTPTPWPTWTPSPVPSSTPLPSPTSEPTEPPAGPVLPSDTPTAEPTEPPVGPVLPTETPTITPTLTVTPSSVGLEFTFSHNGGISAGEWAWLREDQSATTQPVKMVLLHHPPSDPDGTGHIIAYGNDAFMALMVEEKVGCVFAGHIHAYPQQERDGVMYTITGGAPFTAGHGKLGHDLMYNEHNAGGNVL